MSSDSSDDSTDSDEDQDYINQSFNNPPRITIPLNIENIDNQHFNIKGNTFSFLFSNSTNDLDFTDVIIPENICTGPLSEYNNQEVLRMTYSCYLIYTNNTTGRKYLLGFTHYTLRRIRDEDNDDIQDIFLNLSLSCVPPEFNGMRINSIISIVLILALFNKYPDIKLIGTDEIAEQNGTKTNGSLSRKLGLTIEDITDEGATRYRGTRESVMKSLGSYPPVTEQLEKLNEILIIRGGRKRKTNKRKKTRKTHKRRKTNKKGKNK